MKTLIIAIILLSISAPVYAVNCDGLTNYGYTGSNPHPNPMKVGAILFTFDSPSYSTPYCNSSANNNIFSISGPILYSNSPGGNCIPACTGGSICGINTQSSFTTQSCDITEPAHCSNATRDSDETGIDCGGSCSAVCTVPPHCYNAIKDSDETGIDCGGSCPNVCTAIPHCTNYIKDSDETGIDCGGSCPNVCTVPPHCTNHIKDEDETGIDCGGSCVGSCGIVCSPGSKYLYVDADKQSYCIAIKPLDGDGTCNSDPTYARERVSGAFDGHTAGSFVCAKETTPILSVTGTGADPYSGTSDPAGPGVATVPSGGTGGGGSGNGDGSNANLPYLEGILGNTGTTNDLLRGVNGQLGDIKGGQTTGNGLLQDIKNAIGSSGSYSSSTPAPYGNQTNTYDFGKRTGDFITTMRSSSLFGAPSQVFGVIPTGTSIVTQNCGRFGTISFDFASFSSIWLTMASVFKVLVTVGGIRIITKGGA